MMRTQVFKLVRAPFAYRSFASSATRAAEGDTGSTRSGGVASSDAFQKREAAEETRFIREKERESLRQLREKLQAQQKHLKELDDHVAEIQKSQNAAFASSRNLKRLSSTNDETIERSRLE